MGRAILNGSWTTLQVPELFVGQLEISMKFAIVTARCNGSAATIMLFYSVEHSVQLGRNRRDI